MKIRAILLAVILLSFLPSAFMGYMAQSSALQYELTAAADRATSLAQSMRFQLRRYKRDLSILLDTAASDITSPQSRTLLTKSMVHLNVLQLATFDFQTGEMLARHSRPDAHGNLQTDRNLTSELRGSAFQGDTAFSAIYQRDADRPVLYAMQRHGSQFTVAEIDTYIFESLANSTASDSLAEAIILDHRNNVITRMGGRHSSRQPFSLSPEFGGATLTARTTMTIQGKIAGQEVIAASAVVPRSKWRILVHEPISAIQHRAAVAQRGSSFALIFGIVLALLSVFVMTRFFAKPLEIMSHKFREDANRKTLSQARLPKDMLLVSELALVHRNYNLLVRRVTESQREIERLAFLDFVTGLANRDSFNTYFQTALDKCRAEQKGGALLYLDLDHFKQINDVLGHAAGDQLLVAVANAIEHALQRWVVEAPAGMTRETFAARLGGDEFAIVVVGVETSDEVSRLMKDIANVIENAALEDNRAANVSASIGGARFPIDDDDCEAILKRADMAMYNAKNAGRGCEVLFNSTHGIRTAGEIRYEFAQAIENGELRLHYQPQVCSRSRKVVGIEALTRWQHPERGLQPPSTWLPAIVNSSIIVKLGEWVAHQAFNDLARLREQGHNIQLAINIGSRHFLSPGFTTMLDESALRAGVPNEKIEIEVTEDALFQSAAHAESVLEDLKDRGFQLSIDDFGRGFSNIARLAELSVQTLKIDRSIVEGARKNPRTRTILASTLSMARDLGCHTIAEGIETAQHAEFATRMGADALQGFHFAKPMEMDDLLTWLSEAEAETIIGLGRRLQSAVGQPNAAAG
ncbi:MAG: bifunctional diguanylate cyclase/phosphodiesterase [Ahrensia sp.]|nr:bifunctional diguanylate cyclase/phosphodiesterase [Ahrensia sp.]